MLQLYLLKVDALVHWFHKLKGNFVQRKDGLVQNVFQLQLSKLRCLKFFLFCLLVYSFSNWYTKLQLFVSRSGRERRTSKLDASNYKYYITVHVIIISNCLVRGVFHEKLLWGMKSDNWYNIQSENLIFVQSLLAKGHSISSRLGRG